MFAASYTATPAAHTALALRQPRCYAYHAMPEIARESGGCFFVTRRATAPAQRTQRRDAVPLFYARGFMPKDDSAYQRFMMFCRALEGFCAMMACRAQRRAIRRAAAQARWRVDEQARFPQMFSFDDIRSCQRRCRDGMAATRALAAMPREDAAMLSRRARCDDARRAFS